MIDDDGSAHHDRKEKAVNERVGVSPVHRRGDAIVRTEMVNLFEALSSAVELLVVHRDVLGLAAHAAGAKNDRDVVFFRCVIRSWSEGRVVLAALFLLDLDDRQIQAFAHHDVARATDEIARYGNVSCLGGANPFGDFRRAFVWVDGNDHRAGIGESEKRDRGGWAVAREECDARTVADLVDQQITDLGNPRSKLIVGDVFPKIANGRLREVFGRVNDELLREDHSWFALSSIILVKEASKSLVC